MANACNLTKIISLRANLKRRAKDRRMRPYIAWDPGSVDLGGFLGNRGDDNDNSEDDPQSEADEVVACSLWHRLVVSANIWDRANYTTGTHS